MDKKFFETTLDDFKDQSGAVHDVTGAKTTGVGMSRVQNILKFVPLLGNTDFLPTPEWEKCI